MTPELLTKPEDIDLSNLSCQEISETIEDLNRLLLKTSEDFGFELFQSQLFYQRHVVIREYLLLCTWQELAEVEEDLQKQLIAFQQAVNELEELNPDIDLSAFQVRLDLTRDDIFNLSYVVNTRIAEKTAPPFGPPKRRKTKKVRARRKEQD